MDVMVDIETLGTAPGAVILSIGAVMFEPKGDALGGEFYVDIDVESAMRAGLHTEPGTILWWFGQNEAARKAITAPGRKPLDHALDAFASWCGSGKKIWGHGATFDPVLIEAAYRYLNKPAPWKYWDARDTRTLFDVAGLAYRGTKHHALEDAKDQALAVQAAYRKLAA